MNTYRNSTIQNVDTSWENDTWDRSTALTIQYQGGTSNCDSWECQMNISQTAAEVLGNGGAENKSPMPYSSYSVPTSYRNQSGYLSNNSPSVLQNDSYCLPSVRSCAVLEAFQDSIIPNSSLHADSISAFPGFTAAHDGSHISANVGSFDQRGRLLDQIVDSEQKAICDYVQRSGIFQSQLHGALGLNLGGRTYFSAEDSYMLGKRPQIGSPAVHVPNCQAEGCTANLSIAKHYYRRHRVCEHHSKASHVFANGQAQRFCQQCSRLHPVGEFDDAKRSCRKRLADHNRRRRKPQMIGCNFSKDHEDQLSTIVDEHDQIAGNKKTVTESGSNIVTKSNIEHLDHETTACLDIRPDSDNCLIHMKPPSLVSVASSVSSILSITNGQHQKMRRTQEAVNSYKQKLQEDFSPIVSSVSLTSIGIESGLGIEYQTRPSAQSLSNDIPSTADPWLVQSIHSKTAFKKSFITFQDSVPKFDDRNMLRPSVSSCPTSKLHAPSAGSARQVQSTKDLACSQWMIDTTAEQKYMKQLGHSITQSNPDEIDSGGSNPMLPVLQASELQDSIIEISTQPPSLVAVDFLQQQSSMSAEELAMPLTGKRGR
ncbi:hypothetical protein O6H91_22G010800 [Diphasiastrum complanatum]|uniref:Uncharacterized protein n=3 Tax=Diphasiastrum complanatum TaxID=34168 RepID=A0ACC2ACP3_DIPCM|nr:hypothetical protein O6H91_22G010800 [Diphasiastrum complanatum]KAJ7515335.1 hypothetical protein O6H91_22G010800 [Diphasiastrum complanatum]KAJ7515336.1 hypothetical protein O6H91_22G010800 [Diphasiastrum complanatum]